MIQFINLTDDTIVLADMSDKLIHIPVASETLFPRSPTIFSSVHQRGLMGGIPFTVRKKTNLVDMPALTENRIYLVSGMISEFAERSDIYTASYTDAIRDEKSGRIVANRSLVRYIRDPLKRTSR